MNAMEIKGISGNETFIFLFFINRIIEKINIKIDKIKSTEWKNIAPFNKYKTVNNLASPIPMLLVFTDSKNIVNKITSVKIS